MSRPLERDDDKTHYLPCQKLAEFIKQNRYDGIRYPSAVCPGGTNIVLFEPNVPDWRSNMGLRKILSSLVQAKLRQAEDLKNRNSGKFT